MRDQIDLATKKEAQFQRMLINNMDAVFKLFFTGMSVLRVKKKSTAGQPANQEENKVKYDHIE